MDAHYHKVMQARESVTEGGARFYFAYSAILDRESFEVWKRQHSYEFFSLPVGDVVKALDVDLEFNFPSRWWGGRVAGLVDKKGSEVYGRLFEVPVKDWPIIQHKEGVVTGMSVERTVRVEVPDNKVFKFSDSQIIDGEKAIVEVRAFATSRNRESLEGPISQRYLRSLIDGAEKEGLPFEYISRLRERFSQS